MKITKCTNQQMTKFKISLCYDIMIMKENQRNFFKATNKKLLTKQTKTWSKPYKYTV